MKAASSAVRPAWAAFGATAAAFGVAND